MSLYFIHNGELYHYGVKGMKWGIRRTPEQLGRKIQKLEQKNYELSKKLKVRDTGKADRQSVKSSKLYSKASKLDAKSDKYRNKSEKLERKANKAKDEETYTKLINKSASYNEKSTRLSDKSSKLNEKAFTLQTKASEIYDYQKSVRAEIDKNERLKSMYNSTVQALDAGTIDQGRIFMKYVYEYDD